MRINTRNVEFYVRVSETVNSPRPVVLRLGGITYSMDAAEATQLATMLADTINEVKTQPRQEKS
jgi:hypothetical protein